MRLTSGTVAVVTGAGSGIGRALAEALARRGCSLALVDRDPAGLEKTRTLVEGPGRKVSLHVVDVSQRAPMEALPETVVREHAQVHLLVNNAGVSLAGPLEQVSVEDLEWIVGTNFWGTVYGCKFFLPHLRREKEAHVVNVLSDFALLGFPTKSAYSATKFGVRGFSEGLRAELHGTGTGVTCVYPGPAATHLLRNGRTWDPTRSLQEERFLERRGIPLAHIAERTLRGVERNAARVLIGPETYAIDLAARLCPSLTAHLLARFRKTLGFV